MESIKVVNPQKLSMLVRSDKALIIDSRTFCEFNTSHIHNSINVWSSKIRKKRLQQDSISVHDYLGQACQLPELHRDLEIIVYDQNAPALSAIPQDSFLHVLLNKLGRAFESVYLLAGGFLEFQARFPELCEDSSQKCSPLTTQSQPCMSVANVGPTRILPFLYLGSQMDANNKQLLQDYNILYELNVSVSCPKPDFVQESHFMRIPVNDNFSEKLLPYFSEAFNFIDKVRESGGCVLVHCLAGISRSATVAIAYVMKHLALPFDEAYMYVKTRRTTISPNINFVGQLAELDRQLKREPRPRDPVSAPILFRSHETHLSSSSIAKSTASFATSFLERHACAGVQSSIPKSMSLNLKTTLEAVPASPSSTPHSPPNMSPCTPHDMSPSTALARLSFASALDGLRDDGLPITHNCPSPATPVSSQSSASPKTAIVRDLGSPSIFNFRSHLNDSPSSPSPSPSLSSVFKSKEVSSRTKSDFRSEAKSESIKANITSCDTSTCTSNSFYTTATFNMGRESTEERTRLRVEEKGDTGRRKAEEREEESSRSRVEERRKSMAEFGREKELDEKARRLSVPVQPSITHHFGEKERQVSVCVIDVKQEESPVRYVRSEPIIVRETQVMATPCNKEPEVRSILEIELKDGQQKEEHITIPEDKIRFIGDNRSSKEIPPSQIQVKKQDGNDMLIITKDKEEKVHRPREVIVPIQIARESRPRVLELNVCAMPMKPRHEPHPIPATAPAIAPFTSPLPGPVTVATAPITGSENMMGIWSPESPQEAATAPPPATPNSPGSPGVQQSDSGIIVEETAHTGNTDLPPSPQRLPRCYSSSETHLNTRRLLEHRTPDFTTRKCSSYDEVGRAWPHSLAPHHHPHHHHNPHHNHQVHMGREGTNTTSNTTWLCPWELARSDSVSTSGFGSEISDTDFPHDDVHSTSTQDESLGPYDAVFADVFPGENQQQRANQPTTPKTPRPASLPGVTGTYFSQFEANTDPGLDMGIDVGSGVELRHQGVRGRRGVEKKDSGYYSFITEHPPVSPRTMGEGARHTTSVPWPKERPRDLRLQVTPTMIPHTTLPSPGLEPLKSHNAPYTPSSEQPPRTITSPEKRMTPEKRKSRGSSTEENEEKRRSCEVEPHQWTPPRQPISIGTGVRRAQELLRDVEQLLDSEMGELRRRTAAMSSRIRLLGRSDASSDVGSSLGSPCSSNSSTSGKSPGSGPTTHIIVTTLEEDTHASVKTGRKETNMMAPRRYPEGTQGCNRARSEPPFPGEEGLYRARSCPGLPRPSAASEGTETVSALVPDLQLVRLRGTRAQPSRDKSLNRYSCGALDSHHHKPAPASAFESCPDFGNLRHCVREGDSIHSSSSSLSSTHSSFTRLLQVS